MMKRLVRALSWSWLVLCGVVGCREPSLLAVPVSSCRVVLPAEEWERPWYREGGVSQHGSFVEGGRVQVLAGRLSSALSGDEPVFYVFFTGAEGLYVSIRSSTGEVKAGARLLVPKVGRWVALSADRAPLLVFTEKGGDTAYFSLDLEAPSLAVRPEPGRELRDLVLGAQGNTYALLYGMREPRKDALALYLFGLCEVSPRSFGCNERVLPALRGRDLWLEDGEGLQDLSPGEESFPSLPGTPSKPSTAGPFFFGEGRAPSLAGHRAGGFIVSFRAPDGTTRALRVESSRCTHREDGAHSPCTLNPPGPVPSPLSAASPVETGPLALSQALSETLALSATNQGGLSLGSFAPTRDRVAPAYSPLGGFALPLGDEVAHLLKVSEPVRRGQADALAALWLPRRGGGLRFSLLSLDSAEDGYAPKRAAPPLWLLPGTDLHTADFAALSDADTLNTGLVYQHARSGQVGFLRGLLHRTPRPLNTATRSARIPARSLNTATCAARASAGFLGSTTRAARASAGFLGSTTRAARTSAGFLGSATCAARTSAGSLNTATRAARTSAGSLCLATSARSRVPPFKALASQIERW